MSAEMIVRRNGDHKDPRLVSLRREGVGLLKKHGAISHKFGFYHSGPHSGQMYVVVGYPDAATQERAMKSLAEDADWTRVAGEIERLAPLVEVSVAVVTEAQ